MNTERITFRISSDQYKLLVKHAHKYINPRGITSKNRRIVNKKLKEIFEIIIRKYIEENP